MLHVVFDRHSNVEDHWHLYFPHTLTKVCLVSILSMVSFCVTPSKSCNRLVTYDILAIALNRAMTRLSCLIAASRTRLIVHIARTPAVGARALYRLTRNAKNKNAPETWTTCGRTRVSLTDAEGHGTPCKCAGRTQRGGCRDASLTVVCVSGHCH